MVPQNGDRVFPITSNAFRLAWDRVRRRAGILDLHFHDLRHGSHQSIFRKRFNGPEVALLSGHRDARMLCYAHPAREEIIRKLRHAPHRNG